MYIYSAAYVSRSTKYSGHPFHFLPSPGLGVDRSVVVTVLVFNGGQSTASSSLTERHFRGTCGEPGEVSKVDRGEELQLNISSISPCTSVP